MRDCGQAGSLGRMDQDRNNRYGKLVARIERVTEVPMLVLALIYLSVFVAEYLPNVPPGIRQDAALAQNVVVAIFAVELALKVAVADGRLAYLRSRWLDVVIVAVPFLRPLRFLHVLRFLPFLARGLVGLQRVMGPNTGLYVFAVAVLTILSGSSLTLIFEEGSGGPIRTVGDALWWAVETITTVGYGDMYPVTAAGRIVAAVVMAIGIALFGVITAGIAAYFVESAGEEEQEEQEDRMERVLAKLDALERSLEELREARDGKTNGGGRGPAPPRDP